MELYFILRFVAVVVSSGGKESCLRKTSWLQERDMRYL